MNAKNNLKTVLINYLNDNEFTSAEKSDVNYKLNSINLKILYKNKNFFHNFEKT